MNIQQIKRKYDTIYGLPLHLVKITNRLDLFHETQTVEFEVRYFNQRILESFSCHRYLEDENFFNDAIIYSIRRLVDAMSELNITIQDLEQSKSCNHQLVQNAFINNNLPLIDFEAQFQEFYQSNKDSTIEELKKRPISLKMEVYHDDNYKAILHQGLDILEAGELFKNCLRHFKHVNNYSNEIYCIYKKGILKWHKMAICDFEKSEFKGVNNKKLEDHEIVICKNIYDKIREGK